MGNEHDLELLSEPESAAIYTFKSVDNSQSQIRVGNRIVVCDAGGGTVRKEIMPWALMKEYR